MEEVSRLQVEGNRVAMLGLMHPVIAPVAMAISSISVVTNANLLRRVDLE